MASGDGGLWMVSVSISTSGCASGRTCPPGPSLRSLHRCRLRRSRNRWPLGRAGGGRRPLGSQTRRRCRLSSAPSSRRGRMMSCTALVLSEHETRYGAYLSAARYAFAETRFCRRKHAPTHSAAMYMRAFRRRFQKHKRGFELRPEFRPHLAPRSSRGLQPPPCSALVPNLPPEMAA